MKELKVKIHNSTTKGGESYTNYIIKVGDLYKNFKTLKTYRVVEIKEEEGKVKLEGIDTRNLTTTLKALTTNYYLEVEASKEEVKEEVEEVKEEVEASITKEEVEEEVKVEESKEEEVGEEIKEEVKVEEEAKVEEVEVEASKEEVKEEVKEEEASIEEEAKDPIEDSIITLEDLNRGDKVTIVTKDLKVYKGEITFLGELTIKIIDTKEFNILKVDILYIFKEGIDLEDLTRFIKDKGIKPEEAKKDSKPNKDKKVTKKDKEEGIITLRDIIEEIVREKLLILDLEYNPNNTFKNIRKKIRKKGEVTKKLRLEGYTYSFRIENKNLIKEELLKILA